jgi:carbon storage regulator
MVGDDVEIKVLSIRRNEIQLGIMAPKHVPVFRKEVFEQISEEKERDSVGYPYFYARQRNTMAVNT